MVRKLFCLGLILYLTQLTSAFPPPPPPPDPINSITIISPEAVEYNKAFITVTGDYMTEDSSWPGITIVIYKKDPVDGVWKFFDAAAATRIHDEAWAWRAPGLELANGEYWLKAAFNDDSCPHQEVFFDVDLE